MTNQPQHLSGAFVATTLTHFQQRAPLVHCMTNDVVQAFTANVLLALNASPAMVIDAEEAAIFSPLADALLINVGTLTRDRIPAMRAAIAAARAANVPWTLDPVAVGALPLRTGFCRELLDQQPAAIRGNASEILVLAARMRKGAASTACTTLIWRSRRQNSWPAAVAPLSPSPAKRIMSPMASA